MWRLFSRFCIFAATFHSEEGNTSYQSGLEILAGSGKVGIQRNDMRAGDDMLDDFKMLFIAHCVGHSNFHCSSPLEFFGLGNSNFKVLFLKEKRILTFC